MSSRSPAPTRRSRSPTACERMRASRAHVDAVADGDRPVYGITTGFGGLARVLIPAATAEMQHAILRSHAAGIGPPVEREVVRAMILLRVATLAKGLFRRAASRRRGADRDAQRRDPPYVPASARSGPAATSRRSRTPRSVCSARGRSLARMAAAGRARLAAAGIAPSTLEAKEGLALINGTDGMLGDARARLRRRARPLPTADVAAALTIEALLGTTGPSRPNCRRCDPTPARPPAPPT